MNAFMDRDFLLDSPAARELYHGFAEGQPIYDFHNHLSARDIAEHRVFRDLYELWLEADHYKWRAMRACGIDEKYVTGDGAPEEKFFAWATVLPRLAGSPLYHWTHLELQRYFDIEEPLCPDSARRIWDAASAELARGSLDAVSALERMNVRTVCTTDDPIDSLEWHQKIAADGSIGFKVLPSFRPDKYLAGTPESLRVNREALCRKYGTDDLKTALRAALDHFVACGCRVSDHGFSDFPYNEPGHEEMSGLMNFLAGEYCRRVIVMQLHLGPIRNNSPRLMRAFGPDAGADSVGRQVDPAAISAFLGGLEARGKLPKTILYNLNPADNRMLSTMAGNFAPLVQYGAAWWFNDTERGIRDQIRELSETGTLSASVGMLTDSRSFTSFVRHEYYRRILCSELGALVESGRYPDDFQTLGKIVRDVCSANAKEFFGF